MNWLVVEHYKDGTTWKHYFVLEMEADWAIEQMTDAHSGRTYEKKAIKPLLKGETDD